MAMTIRPSEEDKQKISSLARTMQVSQHEAVMRAVRKVHSEIEHSEAVARGTEKTRKRYAALNEKLKGE